MIPLCVGVALICTATYGVLRRHSIVILPFAALLYALALWITVSGLAMLTHDLAAKVLLRHGSFIGASFVPSSFLAIALILRERRSPSMPVWIAIWSIPIVFTQIALTNHSHGLIWATTDAVREGDVVRLVSTWGAGFYAFLLFGYGSLAVAAGMLARTFFASRGHRSDVVTVVVGVAAPCVTSALSLFMDVDLIPGFDITPYGLAVSGLVLSRYALLGFIPIARPQIVEELADPVVAVDVVEGLAYVNRAGRELFGLPEHRRPLPLEQVLGAHPALLSQVEAHADRIEEVVMQAGERPVVYEARVGRLTAPHVPEPGRVLVLRDVTDRRLAEDQARELAFCDPLTGLPNRELFRRQLDASLHHARRSRSTLAVLFLDLDDFKKVNDTFGHSVGDRLLRDVANRFRLRVRVSDTVARRGVAAAGNSISRLGGDEFTFLLADIGEPADAALVADRLIGALREPFDLGGFEVFVGASVGIALFPHDGEDAETLLRNADAAMYAAKRAGHNASQFYDASMNQEHRRRYELERRLRGALERDEFRLLYQPLRDGRDGTLVGAEALLRWCPREGDSVPIPEVITVAEETGLIVEIGAWVLRTACLQSQAWRDAGYESPRISVNVSGRQLRQRGFVDTLVDVINETDIPIDRIELEITESTILQHDETTTAALADLQAMSIGLALDDFGTGYSSLTHLRRLPLQRVKIDRSFTDGVVDEPDDAALCKALIAMAHAVSLEVVAEGVETEAQAAFLREQGCDELQGYLFSRPIPPEEFERFLVPAKTSDPDV